MAARRSYRQPGDRAAIALRARGKRIVDVSPAAAAPRLADFSGATAIRTAREVYGAVLGPRFETLLVEKPDFAEGAYDNILLGALFRVVFGTPYAAARGPAPFAAPDADAHLSGSATPEELRAALAAIRDRKALATPRRVLRKVRSRAHPPRGPRGADPRGAARPARPPAGARPRGTCHGPRQGGSSGRARTTVRRRAGAHQRRGARLDLVDRDAHQAEQDLRARRPAACTRRTRGPRCRSRPSAGPRAGSRPRATSRRARAVGTPWTHARCMSPESSLTTSDASETSASASPGVVAPAKIEKPRAERFARARRSAAARAPATSAHELAARALRGASPARPSARAATASSPSRRRD